VDLQLQFPSDQERLRRRIEADRGLSVGQRLAAVDENRRVVASLPRYDRVEHDRLRQIRSAEVRAIFRDLIQRQLEQSFGDAAGDHDRNDNAGGRV
jgi:hypothetical protein